MRSGAPFPVLAWSLGVRVLLTRGSTEKTGRAAAKLAAIALFAVAVCAAGSSARGADGVRFSPGVSGLTIAPVIIQKELGRFLWLPDTRVGQFIVGNRGATPVVVSIKIMGLAHDEDGSIDVLPCLPEVAAALVLSPSAPVIIAPGSSAAVRVSLDRAYANRRDRSGLCAALIVSGAPARDRLAATGVHIGNTITLPVMVGLPGRGQARLAVVDVCAEGARDGEDRPALTVRVANEGGAYARFDGRVLIAAADGSFAMEARITPALVLPGCVRACVVEMAGAELLPGAYRATVQLRVDGKAVGDAQFILQVGPEITTSFPGRP